MQVRTSIEAWLTKVAVTSGACYSFMCLLAPAIGRSGIRSPVQDGETHESPRCERSMRRRG
jgi:hypothetical protein